MQISSEQRLNPACIRVLSWNVMKQARRGLADDLATLSRDLDLALLQEVHVEGACLNTFNGDWHRSFAPGFTLPGRTTGVMTLSSAGHRTEGSLRHPEPLLRTPKAANLTTYALDGCSESLLVINLHAVNFSLGMTAYIRQLHDLLAHIDRHDGPVIFAGDFNAWHVQRKRFLDEIACHRGLREVTFEDDRRMRFFGCHLDYMFVRDLQVIDAHTRHSDASDHNPLLATLGL